MSKTRDILEGFFNNQKPQSRYGNPLPDKDKYEGFYNFCKKLDIGIMDMDNIAYESELGKNLDDLDISFGSMKNLWQSVIRDHAKRNRFIQAIKDGAGMASDMTEDEIIKIILA